MRKVRSCRIHAKKRVLQRYGISLNRKDFHEIVKKIQKGEGTFLKKRSNRLSNWLITYNGQELIVGYDKLRHTVVTFLPKKDKKEEKIAS